MSTSPSTVLGIPCYPSPATSSSIVEISRDDYYRKACIKTTVTNIESDIDFVVNTFLSNNNNRKKFIGLDTERAQSGQRGIKTVLLQLCDGDHCLIIQPPSDIDKNLPRSLFNFLNLSEFTFVGFDIKKTLKRLESEWGLTCKNAVEIDPHTWKLNEMGSSTKSCKPTSPVIGCWGNYVLDENQIKLATSNAYVPYIIGNSRVSSFRL